MSLKSLLLILSLFVVSSPWPAIAERPDPRRWQATIEEVSADDGPAVTPGLICFVGSSSIRMWDLERWFPDYPTINRGFGGSHIADCTYYADPLIIKHRPAVVVFYVGDNDIAAGLTPEQVAEDYRVFVNRIRATLPEVQLL